MVQPARKRSLELVQTGYQQGEFGDLQLVTAPPTYSRTNLAYVERLRETGGIMNTPLRLRRINAKRPETGGQLIQVALNIEAVTIAGHVGLPGGLSGGLSGGFLQLCGCHVC